MPASVEVSHLRDMQEAQRALGETTSDPSAFDRRSQQRDPDERRSPLRPEKLISSRVRVAGRTLSILFRAIDIVLAGAVMWAALAFSSPQPIAATTVGEILPFVVGVFCLAVGLTALNTYALRPREALSTHLARVTVAFAFAGLFAFGALTPIVGVAAVGRALGPFFTFAFLGLYIAHATDWAIVRSLRRAGKLTANIILVGGGRNAERMIEAALSAGDVAILGIFDDRGDRAPKSIRGVTVLGDINALLTHRIMPYVDQVVIAVPSAAQARVRQMIERLGVLPNPVSLFVDIDGDLRGEAVARIGDAPLALLSGKPNDAARAAVKRGQDLVIGTIALLIATPVMAAIAVAVRLDSKGPVFFRQKRHGFNNEEIVVWKFRTMRQEASDPNAKRQVEADDERVTRVGRVLRRLSLDELPQILNVLKGEMSLVGPRPHAIGMMTGETESAKLVAEYAHRHRMKPGITGWAAIKGSRGPVDTPASVRRRVALDIEYVERQSFWLDLYIIAMTIPCLFGDDEAVR